MILRQPLTINCPAKVLLGLTVKEDPRILLLMGALSGTCSARIVVWSFMMDPVLQQQPLPVSVWLEGHCAPPRAAPNSTAGIAKQVSCLPEAQLETSWIKVRGSAPNFMGEMWGLQDLCLKMELWTLTRGLGFTGCPVQRQQSPCLVERRCFRWVDRCDDWFALRLMTQTSLIPLEHKILSTILSQPALSCDGSFWENQSDDEYDITPTKKKSSKNSAEEKSGSIFSAVTCCFTPDQPWIEYWQASA